MNGSVLPISRRLGKDLREKFVKFHTEKIGGFFDDNSEICPCGICPAVLAGSFWLLYKVVLPRTVDRRIHNYQKDLLERHFEEINEVYMKMRGSSMIFTTTRRQ